MLVKVASYNPGHNIWNFLVIYLTSESPQVKRYLISSITNLVHKTQPNSQSSFLKLNVDNSCQKTRKIRYYIFEVLPNFIVSLYSVPNILSRIVAVQGRFKRNKKRKYLGAVEKMRRGKESSKEKKKICNQCREEVEATES